MAYVLTERWCIAIIGGHDLWRESLCVFLSRIMPSAMVFESADDTDPVFHNAALSLILFHLSPPYLRGLERLSQLRRRFRLTPIIMISDVQDNLAELVVRVHSAHAFLRASASGEELLSTIADVLGGRQISQHASGKRKDPAFPLSPRQVEVYLLLCQGKTNKEIGTALSMSDNTVRTHVSAIFDMLGVRNRTEAAALGCQLV